MEKYTIDISAIDNNHETVTTIDMQAKFAMVASAISTYANKVKLLGAKHLGDIAIVSNKISIYLQSLNNGDFVGNFSHINEYFGDKIGSINKSITVYKNCELLDNQIFIGNFITFIELELIGAGLSNLEPLEVDISGCFKAEVYSAIANLIVATSNKIRAFTRKAPGNIAYVGSPIVKALQFLPNGMFTEYAGLHSKNHIGRLVNNIEIVLDESLSNSDYIHVGLDDTIYYCIHIKGLNNHPELFNWRLQ